MWRVLALCLVSLMGLSAYSVGAAAGELESPVRIEAEGKPIDTDFGHAAPLVGDFDGDGVHDLLVGQFGEGILWIYRNEGTNSAPKFAAGAKFQNGTKEGRVPTG